MMKSTLFVILLCWSVAIFAQKTFSEGTITFDVVTILAGKKIDSLASYIQMVKGVHYRSDLFSSVGKSTTIFDMREGAGAIIRDFGSQKIMTRLNRENWQEINKKFSDLNYVIASDTLILLGYTCNKASAVLDNGAALEVLYTTSLVPDKADMFSQLGDLPGLVLGFSSTVGETTVTYRAKSLSFDPVQIQKFDLPVKGYRIMSFEESKRKQN